MKSLTDLAHWDLTDGRNSIEVNAITRALVNSSGKGVRVGVIDSGYCRSWADARVAPGMSAMQEHGAASLSTVDDDRIGHGTACADLILRVAPHAEIVPIRIFGDHPESSPRILSKAIRRATELQLDVINVSMGTLKGDSLRPLYAACEFARQRGLIIVAAVHGFTGWSAPAIFENCIGVGRNEAVDDCSIAYRFDDAVEFVACGEHKNVAWIDGRRVRVRGTSFAAAIVSGWFARMRSAFPGANLDETRRLWRSEQIAR